VANLTISNRMVSVGPLGGGMSRLTIANDLTIVSNGGFSVGGVAIARGVNETIVGPSSNPVVTVGGNLLLTGGGILAVGVSGQGSAIGLTVGTNVLVDGSGSALVVGGLNQGPTGAVSIGNALTLTNGGAMSVYGGATNAATTNFGTLVTIPGVVSIGPASWIYSYSNPTNGGSVLFRVGSLAIATNGGISADAFGFAAGYGPGKGVSYSGGAYGGQGGNGYQGGGVALAYGSTNAPIDPGSGGASAAGGGLIRIEALGDVIANGIITANGVTAQGGSSGGGIFIACSGAFNGSTSGVLRANGGDGVGFGAGGGGRIAVWYGVPPDRYGGIADGSNMKNVTITNRYARFTGTLLATNGVGCVNLPPNGAEPGTIVFLTVTRPGSVMSLR